MKKVFVVLVSILFLVGVATATPIYVGTGGIPSEFDTWENVQGLIDAYNLDNDPDLPDLTYFYMGVEIDELPEVVLDPSIEYTNYSLTDIEEDLPYGINYPVYVSFKYSTEFELYFLPDGEDAVFPLNVDNWEHGLSHYRVWSPAPVPEPTTMLLLGTGLIGLGTISRKRVFKT